MRKISFTSLPTKAKELIRKKPVVLIAISLVLVGVSIATVASPSTTSKTKATEEHRRELLGAVDTSDGMPQDGRDPASQPQNSLASAASKPEGPGQRVSSEDVTSAGCIIGYGKPGEQCLPTPGEDKTITCEYVHSKGFHHGLEVTGTDQFHLDKNHDKTACSHDD